MAAGSAISRRSSPSPDFLDNLLTIPPGSAPDLFVSADDEVRRSSVDGSRCLRKCDASRRNVVVRLRAKARGRRREPRLEGQEIRTRRGLENRSRDWWNAETPKRRVRAEVLLTIARYAPTLDLSTKGKTNDASA